MQNPNLGPEFSAEVEQFIDALDELCGYHNAQGIDAKLIAGTLLARSQNWYLKDDPTDLAGLEDLMTWAADWIRQRPRFDID